MTVILIFFVGYLIIAIGNIFYINKIIPSILMATLSWSLINFLKIPVYELNNFLIKKNPGDLLLIHLGKTSEIIFFLINAMLIIIILEEFFAFEALNKLFYSETKRKFLWKISISSFCLSAIIDNLTATIVILTILKKTITDYKTRLYYLGLVIISSNAGGVWSPIGDITTTMLWINNKVTTFYLVKKILIPSFICMTTSTIIASSLPIFNGKINHYKNCNYKITKKNLQEGFFILKIGLILMLLVPIYKIIIGIPPFMGIMLSLGILLTICSIKYKNKFYNSIDRIFKKLEISSLIFFLGILLSVSALESIGVLYKFSYWINHIFYNWKITTFIFGIISSVIDNVPLIAAIIPMFSNYLINHNLWHFMAYVSGTGGSLLLIGSASGIATMGMEKIDFIWYLKKISWIALIGYISGYTYLLILN